MTVSKNLITVDDMGWIRILDPQEFDDANKLRHTSKTLQQGLFAYSIGVIILIVTDFGTLLKESKELLMIMKKRADIVEAQKKRVNQSVFKSVVLFEGHRYSSCFKNGTTTQKTESRATGRRTFRKATGIQAVTYL
jgi:hypothetical protein